MRLKKIICVILASSLSVGFSGCAVLPKEESTLAPPLIQPAKVTYDQYDVKKGTIELDVKGQGTFSSSSLSNEFFKYGVSYLKDISVKLGDTVKAGQVIAEQDTEDLETDLKKKQLKLQMDQITLNKLQNQLNSAKDDNQKQDLTTQLEQQNINIEMDKLDQGETEKAISRSQIKASIAGKVVYVDTINPGDKITPYKTVVTIADPTKLQLKYTGNDVDKFSVGTKVQVSYNGSSYDGVVVMDPSTVPNDASNNNQGNSTSSTPSTSAKKSVYIKLDSMPKDVQIGDSASILLVLEKKENVIVIPQVLVHQANDRNYVEMLEKGLRVQRNVEVGIKTSTDAEIVKGLNEGEKILK